MNTDNSHLISVIVPVFNAEHYLDKCIQSILLQTYTNFELILINDGSTDKSKEICEQYQVLHPDKIKLLNKVNGGPACARNFGLEHLNNLSQYVCFVDSDDIVSPCYIEQLLLPMDRVDLSCGGMIRSKETDYIAPMQVDNDIEIIIDFKNQPHFYDLLKIGKIHSPWTKLFRVDIIQKEHLRFQNYEISEDFDFNLRYLSYCKSIGVSRAPIYCYVKRPGSVTSRASTDMFDINFELHQYLLDNYPNIFSAEIDNTIYRQYEALAIRFTKLGRTNELKPYLSHPLVQQACRSFVPQSLFERSIRFALQRQSTSMLHFLLKLVSIHK